MRPKFLHVVATRHGIGVFDEGWFAYRQMLFEHLTFASVSAQTTDEYLWLIAIDAQMPQEARKRLERLVGDKANIEIVEVDLLREFRATLCSIAQQRARDIGAEYVLTSRLDDDDAVNVELFERIHEEVGVFLDLGKSKRAVFAPAIGVDWVPKLRRGHRVYREGHSIALSLLERPDNMESVYKWAHKKLKPALAYEQAYFRNIEGDTTWWLYSATPLSDQNDPKVDRENLVAGRENAFDLSMEELASFGLSVAGLDLIAATPDPVAVDTTHYLTKRNLDVEKQISDLRKQLQKNSKDPEAQAQLSEQIGRLYQVRFELGSNIVRR